MSRLPRALLALAALTLVHCGMNAGIPVHKVGGTVTGLAGGGLVLVNNDGPALAIAQDGAFSFPEPMLEGARFIVTVRSQPTSPWQTCRVAGGDGGVAGGDVTSVLVNCVTHAFALEGVAAGVAGTGLLLTNGADAVPVSADGLFTFPSPVPSGASYAVTIQAQPTNPWQTCSLVHGAGTVADATPQRVAVSCLTEHFALGGTLSGLVGAPLLLANGPAVIQVGADGPFLFPHPLASGEAFEVTLPPQERFPSQTCAVVGGTGVVGGADVGSVAVSCATDAFPVGGTVVGLAGAGLVLQDGAATVAVSGPGTFAFPAPVLSGASYGVTVAAQPLGPEQACTISGGAGTVGLGPVTAVAVSCSTRAHLVRVRIAGYAGTGLAIQNGADLATFDRNGEVAFDFSVLSGQPYDVQVVSQPVEPWQTCLAQGGAGVMATADVPVTVTCTTRAFTVGGAVSGLSGTIALRLNGGDPLPLAANGAFVFPAQLASGAGYEVTLDAQPLGQRCAVSRPAGTVGGADVTDVAVTCATDVYPVRGSVLGLKGTGLVLANAGGDAVAVFTDGTFTFPDRLPVGAPYAVTISTQPSGPAQACTVSHAAGTVPVGGVSDVAVTCTTRSFTVGGTVSGLAGGAVTLASGADTVVVSADGPFTFPRPLQSGTGYSVTVAAQPSGPAQVCTVASGLGVVGAADVTGVAVSCSTLPFRVRASVTGLAGSGLVLRDNGTDAVSVPVDGTYTFVSPLSSGAAYAVTVAAQPASPWQTCTVSGGSGTIAGLDVTAAVHCATNAYLVGGAVSGLAGAGLVLSSDGDTRSIAADGPFAFATPRLSGSAWSVAVASQPAGQTCAVSPGGGVVAGADVTGVSVTCSSIPYAVGGTVAGLSGHGLVLRNGGGDPIAVASNGAFAFPSRLAAGSAYAVTVAAQPSLPWQTCSVVGGSGTVGAGDVTSVAVTCTTNAYRLGGTVSGLTGAGLVLQDAGGGAVAVAADGPFTLPASLLSGTGFAVAVASQPSGPTQLCSVTGGVGTVAGADVTGVAVSCAAVPFRVHAAVSGLAGSGLVLRDNGLDPVTVGSDGTVTFVSRVPSGAPYAVTISAQPVSPWQTCLVAGGSGIVGAADVTATVTCTTNAYRVGGTVSGLTGAGLVLRNAGADPLAVPASGPFTFPAALPSGSTYAVTVDAQPAGQACAVSLGSGTVAGADVASVVVTCTP